MKIKKALALVVGASLCIAALTGCSQATQNYGQELNKVSKWEAYTTESSGTYTISAQGINQTVPFTGTSYSCDNKTYGEIKYDNSNGDIKMPDMKIYNDGLVTYINKGYYEDMFTMSGQSIPEGLKNLNAEYIGVDSDLETDELIGLRNNVKDYTKLAENLLDNSTIDLPFVQNGREYELNLDSDKIAELQSLLVKNIASKNSSDNTKNQLTDEDVQKSLDEMKELYTGSTLSSKTTFEDNKYTSIMNFDFKANDLSEIKMTSDSSCSKCDKKDFTFPTNLVKLTQEEFANLLGQEDSNNSASLVKTIE